MDLARGVVGRIPAVHGPRPHFVLADREERLESQQAISRVNEAVEPRLGDAGAREILAALVARQLGKLGLEFGGEEDDFGFFMMTLHRRAPRLHPFPPPAPQGVFGDGGGGEYRLCRLTTPP